MYPIPDLEASVNIKLALEGRKWGENKVLIHFGFDQIKAGVMVFGPEEMGIFLDKLPQRFSRH